MTDEEMRRKQEQREMMATRRQLIEQRRNERRIQIQQQKEEKVECRCTRHSLFWHGTDSAERDRKYFYRQQGCQRSLLE